MWECEDVANFMTQMKSVAKLLGKALKGREIKQKVMDRCQKKFE